MLITLETSHVEMSPLNDEASGPSHVLNKLFISVTAETSQDPIGPCGPVKQSVGDSSRHSLMVALSSALDFGAYPVVGYYNGWGDTVELMSRVRTIIKLRASVSLRDRVKIMIRWLGSGSRSRLGLWQEVGAW